MNSRLNRGPSYLLPSWTFPSWVVARRLENTSRSRLWLSPVSTGLSSNQGLKKSSVRKPLQMTDDCSDITRDSNGWTICWSFDLISTSVGRQIRNRKDVGLGCSRNRRSVLTSQLVLCWCCAGAAGIDIRLPRQPRFAIFRRNRLLHHSRHFLPLSYLSICHSGPFVT
jgi:hypothetical protein